MVHAVMEKTTAFLIDYCKAYKAAGANGVVMAEPLTGTALPQPGGGVLPPLCGADRGRGAGRQLRGDLPQLRQQRGAHGGRHLRHWALWAIISATPSGWRTCCPTPRRTGWCMGNVDPAGQLRNGTPESIRAATLQVMEDCSRWPNFVPSTGCDVPPMSSWENIDAFFSAVAEFQGRS